ncbi:hypothetical protein EV1_031395 [Malus domestica]
MNGIDPSYTTWVFHGEQEPILQQHDYANMTTYQMYRDVLAEDDGPGKTNLLIGDENFKQKVEEVEAHLYEGCTKYTKLSATVVLYKIKASNGATYKLFDELLQALKDMFLEGNTLPNSMNSTKKLLEVFDLGFEKIYACVNDCCLFWKDFEQLETCPKCGSSCWQIQCDRRSAREADDASRQASKASSQRSSPNIERDNIKRKEGSKASS